MWLFDVDVSRVSFGVVLVCWLSACVDGGAGGGTGRQQRPPQVLPEESCGGTLYEPRGVIQTPNFPGRFRVPIKCKWIVDASAQSPNTTVVVYLTQLFVTTGLKFTETPFYDPELSYSMGEKFGEKLIHSVTEKNIKSSLWLRTSYQYLIIEFELDQLEGNHVRALDDLLDVYGFNITYEARSDTEDAVRTPFCNVVACSYEGHCYANENFTEYWCSCFPGFSGADCGQGPLCRPDRNSCENNATCRHVGATAVYCNCPAGYTGTRCDVVMPSSPSVPDCRESDGKSCILQCPFKDNQTPCACTQGHTRAPTERARYQNAVRLAPSTDGTTVKDFIKSFPNRTLHQQIERQISKYLRNKIPKIDELRVINITSEGDVTFHFFGGKRDGRKVRDALNELMEKRQLGNITLVSTQLGFRQEPTLLLQSVRVNQKRPVVRYGDEFILSCIAQGSSYMTFRWLKDGIIINESKALRNIWSKLLPLDSNDQYTALLGIKNADTLDQGRYTCQVTDWGFEQCKSIDLEVIPPPLVKVTPMTITLEKGQNLNIVCMWPIERADIEQVYGYSWFKEAKDSKDAHLFKMKQNVEVWEDLHPAGSILRVYNIQKSTRYTCQVQSNVKPVNASVDVEILNKSAVPWCKSDETGLGGVRWTEAGAWGVSKVECPAQYTGVATRLCSLVNPGQASWQTPDFSDCVSDRLSDLGNQFKSLTLGFQNTSGAETISGILGLLRDRSRLYPGEGEPTLSLMQNISWYLNFTSAWDDLIHATPFFFSTINTLLQHRNAIINSQKLVDLQKLVNQWAVLWASHIGSNVDPTLTFDSLIVDVFSFESSSVQSGFTFDLPRNTHSYPSWFKTSLTIILDNDSSTLRNGTYTIAVIIYKDIMKYLPERHIYKKDDGTEMEYEVASNVVSVVSNAPLQVMTEVKLETRVRRGWNMTCGVMATPWTKWQLERCYVNVVPGGNITQCSCRMMATFTALITKATAQNESRSHPRGDSVVLLGCLCCLVQCLLTIALLLVRWYHNPTCLLFLKLQCCVAIAATMGVFFSATRASLQQSAYPYIVTSLEAFLLLGMSSHLSKLLLVYTEVVHLPKIQNIKQTVICIITGFPVLIVLCNYLAHNSTGWNLKSWWLIRGTVIFYSCITCGLLLAALFVFLYCSVMRRLALLSTIKTVHTDSTKAIQRRVGLLKRAAIIFVTMFVMAAASIFYVNYPGPKSQYAFSFTCALLGFVLLICYVVHSESSLHLHILQKLNPADIVYSSGSDSNPLSFFTKQDGEIESEAAPPVKEPAGCDEESIQMKEVPLPGTTSSQTDIGHKTGKMVTFHSDLVTGCDKGGEDVDLESYPNSPRKLKLGSPSDAAESCDEPVSSDKWQFVRTSYYQNPAEYVQGSQPPQEIVTTRVCVELGVITNSDKGDHLVEAPTIVLCSVDVEPCQGKVVELNEVTVTTVGENGNPSPDILNHEPKSITSKESTVTLAENACAVSEPKKLDLPKLISGAETKIDNDGDVLDRISHDLDYLLNRNTHDSNGNTSEGLTTFQRKPLLHIKEEDELGNTIASSGLIAKTSL